MKVAALVSDLMFTSKIREVALAQAVEVQIAKDPAAIADDSEIVVIDLEARRFSAVDALVALRSRLPNAHLIGFFSHVNEELGAKALEAGANEVMPRSKFVRVLPDLVKVE